MIFPLAYWASIRGHAARQDLDPFLVARLIAQESTFVPDIRSSANAVGLMQFLPSTARQVAGTLNTAYSSRLLTAPDDNIRLGTAYFRGLLRTFGGTHLALAACNAGPARVRTWLATRTDLAPEEFIDDIPFAETRAYVKPILGATENYRRLYADGGPAPVEHQRGVPSLASQRQPR